MDLIAIWGGIERRMWEDRRRKQFGTLESLKLPLTFGLERGLVGGL